jgi:hypothetical protein
MQVNDLAKNIAFVTVLTNTTTYFYERFETFVEGHDRALAWSFDKVELTNDVQLALGHLGMTLVHGDRRLSYEKAVDLVRKLQSSIQEGKIGAEQLDDFIQEIDP